MKIELDVTPYAVNAHWTDSSARYHVWLHCDAYGVTPDDVLHKNALDPKIDAHRSLDFTAKKWAAHRAAVVELATIERIAAMRDAEIAARDAAESLYAEAWKLNRLFDAIATVRAADDADIEALKTPQPRDSDFVYLAVTWRGVLPIFAANWHSDNAKARQDSRNELARMADLADRYAAIFR
jgi:hypothetical protein